jgi:hypothetical protein
MAPRRPAVYPDQLGLVLVCAVVIGLGIWVFVRTLTG